MTVAFQGTAGAYSEAAAAHLYPEATPQPCDTFADLFEAVANKTVQAGVVPIENSLFGSVHANYDHLRTHDVHIEVGQFMRIRHCLMAPSGTTRDTIRTVHSHPQALGQCQNYVARTLPDAEPVAAYDTAGAARAVAKSDDRTQAAIASKQAAIEYGLTVLAEGIEDHNGNYTRFLGIRAGEAEDHVHPQANRTSVVFALRENVPGALFKSLAVFALRELDLCKMESRPQFGTPGQYLFYVDVAGSYADTPLRRALGHLHELTTEQKLLGAYHEAPIPTS
ncbi:MAG: prephenate dehydratase [Longimonas sp.]|uniref:prephenate dehydratase n=1 Tax=Longimonas sp. TaxID=2039626 RepID=UPI003974DC28